ncbi:MAG TPA: hypothetical protein VKV21_03130 [Solirubrobacteraceae bacterium]|nr:hypothetical protein [Solirubrobacteraceae bacterium]
MGAGPGDSSAATAEAGDVLAAETISADPQAAWAVALAAERAPAAIGS